MINLIKTTLPLSAILLLVLSVFQPSLAEELDSTNYTILDSSIGSGGDVTESSSYSLLQSIDPMKDIRLTSGSYAINSTSSDTFEANIPLVSCFETNTIFGNF